MPEGTVAAPPAPTQPVARGTTPGAPPPGAKPPNPTGAAPAPVGGKSNGAPEMVRDASGRFVPKEELKTPPDEKPAAPQKLKFKHKVHGQEIEKEYELDEVGRRLQQEEAWEVRQRRVAERETKLQAFESELEGYLQDLSDPRGIIKAIKALKPDVNPVDFLTEALHPLLEEKQKLQDPKDQEIWELKQRLQAREKDERRAAEEAAAAKKRAEVEAEESKMASTWKQALEVGKLVVDDLTLSLMAGAHFTNREGGIELEPAQLAKATEDLLTTHLDGHFAKYEGEALLDRFPKIAKAIHSAIVARHHRRQAGGGQQANQPRVTASGMPHQEEKKPPIVNSKDEYSAFPSLKRTLRTI